MLTLEIKYAVIGNVRSEKAMRELQLLFNTLLGSDNINQTVFYKWWHNGRKTVIFMHGAYVLYGNIDEYENMENIPVLKSGNILNNDTVKSTILFEVTY